jgi:hypothetical protein
MLETHFPRCPSRLSWWDIATGGFWGAPTVEKWFWVRAKTVGTHTILVNLSHKVKGYTGLVDEVEFDMKA